MNMFPRTFSRFTSIQRFTKEINEKINDSMHKNRDLLLHSTSSASFSIFVFRGCTIMKVWPLIIFAIYLIFYMYMYMEIYIYYLENIYIQGVPKMLEYLLIEDS